MKLHLKFLLYLLTIVFAGLSVFSPSLTVALSAEQKALYNKNILYYDIDECGAGGGVGTVEAGEGSPTGTLFPDLDPAAMADAINRFIKRENPNSKLNNTGETIVASAENSNISPFLIVSQAYMESGLAEPGISDIFDRGNNSFGRSALTSQPHIVSQGAAGAPSIWYKWSTVKASVDHTAHENKNAAGGGDIAAYLREQYGDILDGGNLDAYIDEYAPDGNEATYVASITGWVKEMANMVNGGRSGNKPAGGIRYIRAGNIPLQGKSYKASVYGTQGEKDSNGNYVEYLGGIEGGPVDEQDKRLEGRSVVAEMKGNTALGGLPYGTKIEITYKNKSVIAEVSDNGPATQSDIDLWREVADLLEFPYGIKTVKIRAVHKDTPLTDVGGEASSPPNGPSGSGGSCACSAGGGSAASVDAELTGTTNGEKVFNYFIGQGLSPEASAGIVGNFMQESGGGTEDLDTRASNGTHTGIAQWDNAGRWPALVDFAEGKNLDPYSLKAQVEWTWEELNNGYTGTLEGLKQADTPEAAATEFEATYEISGGSALTERKANARKIFNKYGDGASAGGSSTSSGCNENETIASVNGYALPVDLEVVAGQLPCESATCHHDGTPAADLGVEEKWEGKPVYAIHAGTISNLHYRAGFGASAAPQECVSLQLEGGDGWKYWYGHIKNPTVSNGDKVKAGQKLALIGQSACADDTPPHLHIDRGSPKGQLGGSQCCRDPEFIPLLNKIYNDIKGST